MMIDQTDDRDPVEVLGEEFLDRRRRGEPITVHEFAAQHPKLAEDIRRLFPTMIAMEQFKVCRLSSAGSEAVELDIQGLEQLGDYRIVGEIGRGGMGVVYEAEQQSLGRRVAVKVFPKQTLNDTRQLQRFLGEARTAAGLHHTNIVPVFGVGEQDGLHYFVMQRIDGVGLDVVLDATARRTGGSGIDRGHAVGTPDSESPGALESLSSSKLQFFSKPQGLSGSRGDSGWRSADSESGRPAEWLAKRPSLGGDSQSDEQEPSGSRARRRAEWRWVAKIGVQVAEAIAYSHAKGVLHRDIKPSNLILDGRGTVWVTDFGLATILEAEQKHNPDDVAGTLRFMSPEQLRGDQDARSDIYSLGLTLYELLTRRPAFDDESRNRLVEKIIGGKLKPPRAYRADIPRDLEAIVLKSVALDPQQRYENAGLMADDLRRFVEGRPVQARPLDRLGRLRRWSRRSPAVASLSAALLLLCVSSFVLISLKWREAVAENERAEDNLSLALGSMDKILQRFASNWMAHPMATEGENGEAAEDIEVHLAVSDYNVAVLQDALKFYNQFAERNASNPQLRRDTAKAHRRVGDIYDRLGRHREAEQAYARSLQILDPDQANELPALAVERASTINQLGLTMYATSRFEEAAAEFRKAEEYLTTTPQKDDPDCRAELARTYNNLGQTQRLLWQRSEARQSHLDAIQLLENLVRQRPYDAGYRLSLARAYRTYFGLIGFGKGSQDRDRIRSAGIDILENLVCEFPNVPDYQYELSEMLATTAPRPRRSESTAPRNEQLERAVDIARQLSQSHPLIPRYRALLARSQRELAESLSYTSPEDAHERFSQSITIYRSLASDFGEIPAYHLFLAMTLREHAKNLRGIGRADNARQELEEAIDEQHAYMVLRPMSAFGQGLLARIYRDLAITLTTLNQPEAAAEATSEANRLGDASGRGRSSAE